MEIDGVLFDFAGTLLVPQPAHEWVQTVSAAVGTGLDETGVAELAGRLEAAGRPGGPEPVEVPEQLRADYARRDDSSELHRRVYEALLGRVTGPATALTRALYDHTCQAAGWLPYPDTGPTLQALRTAGIGIAVVSNVGFDLRAIFAGHRLAGLVDAFVLSCELGVMKPDAALFRAGLNGLGTAPARTLMVGDNFRADGGAAELGIRTLLLPYSSAGADHGLSAVLDLAGVARV